MELIKSETPKELSNVTTFITGSVKQLCKSAAVTCRELGYEPIFLTASLSCEAREAGAFLASIVRDHQDTDKSLAFLCGGETVVHLTGKGLGGRNQEIALGAAEGLAGCKNTCVFSVGSDGTDGPTDAAGGIADENSLRRLGTDYIDLYQIHYRDGKTDLDTVMGVLEDLRREGKIRYAGVSNLGIRDLPELECHKGSLCTIQNQYSMACRDYEEDLMGLADALELTTMTWGSLGQGILTGKYDANVAFGSDDRRSRDVYVNFHGQKLQKNLDMVEQIREMAFKYGKPVSAVAVRFILDHLSGSVAFCGAKRPDQILGNAQALGWKLEEKDLERLEYIAR
jgi:diketogulonate reductase-like aldo/keto reductase